MEQFSISLELWIRPTKWKKLSFHSKLTLVLAQYYFYPHFHYKVFRMNTVIRFNVPVPLQQICDNFPSRSNRKSYFKFIHKTNNGISYPLALYVNHFNLSTFISAHSSPFTFNFNFNFILCLDVQKSICIALDMRFESFLSWHSILFGHFCDCKHINIKNFALFPFCVD